MTAAKYQVERTADGARVLVAGVVRATFVGDLDDPEQRKAFDEMVRDLFQSGSKPEVPPQ